MASLLVAETWVKCLILKVKIRLKFDLLFINSLSLVFPSGSSLKSQHAELFLVSLSTSERSVGRNSNCVKTNET